GDVASALKLLLNSPPYGPSSSALDNAKSLTLSSVIETLSSTRTSEIASIVQSFDQSEQDWLMKYLYKGMSSIGDSNSAVLLNWHEKVIHLSNFSTAILSSKLTPSSMFAHFLICGP
ncbi:hypothetical protein PSTG_18772, partial [Puccinia striiformis f. sp. tritici PST-78]